MMTKFLIKEVVFVVCCIFLARNLRVTTSQGIYGHRYCLLSRLDVVPCWKNISITPDPDVNQYSVYRTTFRIGRYGHPVCNVTIPSQDFVSIRDIESIGIDGQVKFLFSPGIELDDPVPYENDLLVSYSVQCPDGHIAYFNVTYSDLEPANCLTSCEHCPPRCVDYLEVDRGAYGVSESCGNDTTSNTDQIEFGNFTAMFRSSPVVQHDGFKATVVCFRDEDPPANCTTPTGSNQRRKRDLKNTRLSHDNKMRCDKEIHVGHQITVNFVDKTLIFVDNNLNETISRVKGILFLHTVDADGKTQKFRKNAVNGEDKHNIISFSGPGPICIRGHTAYFQLYVINPKGILPNSAESAVIRQLSDGQFDALVLQKNRLSHSSQHIEAGWNHLKRERRETVEDDESLTFSDEILLIAIQSENACNKVLRASAQATLQSANQTDVERVRNMTNGN